MSTPATPPLTLSRILEETRRLLEARPLELLLPLVLLGLITSGGDAGPRFGADDVDFDDPFPSLLFLIPFFALFGLIALIIFVLVFLAYTLASLVTTDIALAQLRGGAAPTWSASFSDVKTRFWPAAGTFALYALVLLVGFLLLVVPGFIAMAGLFPLAVVVVAERQTGPDALRRAWDITKGHKGTTFLLILLGVVANIVAGILSVIPIIGNAIAGALNGAIFAALLVAAVVFYHHVAPAPAAPPVAAPPTVA